MQEKFSQLSYYKWLIFITVASGTFMSTLTSSIVNVALPNVITALHTDLTTAQWVVSAYLLVITSALPLTGRLGDIFGRRTIYSLGFLGFIFGSFLCGFASTIEMLIVSRLVQAIGAAGIMANAPAIVTSGFPLQERGKVLGMIGTVVALGTLTGPSVGGILVEAFSWHWIFWVNIPVGILGYTGSRYILPIDIGARHERIDYLGAFLFTIGMSSFLLVLSHGVEWGWKSPIVFGLAVSSVVAFLTFSWHEKRTQHPMLDLSIFRIWPFLAGNLSGTFSFMALFGNTMLLPFYLHDMIALTPSKVGLVMSAFPLVMAIVAPFSGTLSDRIGSLALTTGGLSILAIGLFYMANLPENAGLWSIIAGQAVMGLGNGLFQSPNNNSVMSSVPPNKLGVAGGINALARNFGMVSGTAVAVSVFGYRYQTVIQQDVDTDPATVVAAFMLGYHDALVFAAFFAVIGAFISFNRKGHHIEKGAP